METIVPIARIQREATAAARQYTDLNAACPYPFGSAAAVKFKEFFNLAKANMTESEAV